MSSNDYVPQLIDYLSAEMAAFEEGFPLADLQSTDFAQHPFATLLCCCDSRVPSSMFGQPFNRIFCIENIGNQVANNMGSIMYGLFHLHTPIMMVVGHSDCGAIIAASADYSMEAPPIQAELQSVKSSLDKALGSGAIVLSEETNLKNGQMAEVNVDMQIEELLANEEIKKLVDEKKLLLLGMVLDLHDLHGGGHGKLYTSNVNGEKKLDEIKKSLTIGDLSRTARRLTPF